MLFPCPPGHSVFTPVDELVPDPRFQSVESVNREWRQHIILLCCFGSGSNSGG